MAVALRWSTAAPRSPRCAGPCTYRELNTRADSHIACQQEKNMTDPFTPTSKQETRQLLYDAVVSEITDRIEEAPAALASDTPATVLDGIRDQIINHSRAVMDACSTSELLSGSAIERHVIDAGR